MSRRDDQILEAALDRYAVASNEWAETRDEATKDMRVLTGGVWAAMQPEAAKQRDKANRPMIAPDELGQYVNQVVNAVRANPLGMQYSPTGNGANDAGARFYEAKFREIEYRSHAKLANTIAFENAVQQSFGFTRISTKYVHSQLFDPNTPASGSFFDQDIWIEPFPNPHLVLPDPFCQRPDLSDMTHAFVLEWLPVAEFKRKYGRDATIVNFTADNTRDASGWFSKDLKNVLTAEYWDKACIGTRQILQIKPPNGMGQPIPVWADEVPTEVPSDLILAKRDVEMYGVTQYITNGVEILQTREWPGKFIPIAGCLGKVYYVDEGDGAKRLLMSMTRLARDPFLLYAFIRTTQLEIAGSVPKFPYFFTEGSLSPEALNLLVKSVSEPVAAIPVKRMVNGQDVGFPMRNPYGAEALGTMEILAEAARRAIQAAMGISPLPTAAQRQNEKSGKALQRMKESGEQGSYHFHDHYEDMIRFEAEIIEDLIGKVMPTARDTAIRGADGKAKIVRVNDPSSPDAVSTQGDYHGTVSAGPDFDSEREAQGEFVDTLIGSPIVGTQPPPIRNKIFSLAVKMKNVGPLGDEIAKILDPQSAGPDDPQAAVQQVQQLHAQLQQLQQIAAGMADELKGKKAEIDAKIQIAQMEIASKERLAALDRETKITVAELGAKVDRLALFLEERGRVGAQIDDTHQAVADRMQADAQAESDRQHEAAMAVMQHQQGLEAADRQGAQQAAMAQQQAAMAPPGMGA